MFPHHRHGHWRRRRMGPIGRYVGARLRRRIFAWFTWGILSTAVLVMLVMTLIARVQEPEWAQTFERGRAWVGKQFAREWDDPAARERFAREAAEDLSADVELYDATGAALLATGAPCGRHGLDIPIARGGQPLGSARLCFRHPPGLGWRWPVMLGVGLFALWMASGRVARRLSRPLDELSEVVRRIGAGDLTARAELSCREPDEIGVVADSVNEMAARIQKQMADQRELLATVSHELRTPLARLRIISELGRDGGATPKTFDDLDREVEEMDALVGELLASSRVEFGQVARRELDVREQCARALERSGLELGALRLKGDAATVSADPTLLQRALANLLDNAKRHGGGADALEVDVGAELTRFEVLDRGKGVPEDAERLFHTFTRGPDGGSTEGLGLGLALVRRIAEAHGGTAWARNREGGGAAVGFSVRTSAAAASAPA
ncbi:MAG: HAMP domain-containing sensor histidine kinase [Myxococcota bacterium]